MPAVPGWSKLTTATPGSTPHQQTRGWLQGLWCVCFVCCSCLSSEGPGQSNNVLIGIWTLKDLGVKGAKHVSCSTATRCHCSVTTASVRALGAGTEHTFSWPCSRSRACCRDLQAAEPISTVCTREVWQGRHRGEPWGCHLSGVPWPVAQFGHSSACRAPAPGCASPGMQGETQLLAHGSAAGTTDPDLILDQHFLHLDKVQQLILGGPSRAWKPPRSCVPPPSSGGSSSLRQQLSPSPRCAGDGRAALGCTGKPRSQRW